MKILNFGSANIDYIYEVPHFVQPGETIKSTKLTKNCGGKGLNQSISMSKSGLKVHHAGMVGKMDGKFLMDFLEGYNVETQYLKMIDVQSGQAIIQVSDKGENCIILNSGSNFCITKEYVDFVLDSFNAGDFCVLQNEINCIDYIINQAHKKGLRIILNPSPYNQELLECPLEYVEYFILNEIEGAQITGKTQENDILEQLIKKYPNSKIVLTLGKNGSIYKSKNEEQKCGIYDVPVVDTTAAGDTFTGYFIYSVINDLPINQALLFATAASSLAVSKKGAAISIPYYDEVISFMSTNEIAR